MNEQVLATLYARRRAFEHCLSTPEVQARLAGVPRCTCPCCGYPTLPERELFVICQICGWEDDGQDDREFAIRKDYFVPDEISGGPNGDYSLTEARANFARHGRKYRLSDIRFVTTNTDPDLRAELIRLFDSLLPLVDPKAFTALLPDIRDLVAARNERRKLRREERRK